MKKRKPVEKILTPEVEMLSENEFKLFLTLNKNKICIQKLLGEALMKDVPSEKTVVVTGAFEDPQDVRSNHLSQPQLRLLESDPKEADTRIVLSAIHSDSARSVIVCNDTDVLIALLSNYEHLNNKEVYLQRSRYEYLDIRKIAEGLSSKGIQLKTLPLFHALSGCDTTSYVYGIEKPRAWSAFLTHHVRVKYF